jgi:hypothetical protein
MRGPALNAGYLYVSSCNHMLVRNARGINKG